MYMDVFTHSKRKGRQILIGDKIEREWFPDEDEKVSF